MFSSERISHRIVRSTVHLRGDDPPDELNGVVADAVDLGAAAEGVRVLDAVAETMAFWI